MDMKSKIAVFILILAGCVSFVVASYNFYSLCEKSTRMEHTVGIVIWLYRKIALFPFIVEY